MTLTRNKHCERGLRVIAVLSPQGYSPNKVRFHTANNSSLHHSIPPSSIHASSLPPQSTRPPSLLNPCVLPPSSIHASSLPPQSTRTPSLLNQCVLPPYLHSIISWCSALTWCGRVVVSGSACHAACRGSVPGPGVLLGVITWLSTLEIVYLCVSRMRH